MWHGRDAGKGVAKWHGRDVGEGIGFKAMDRVYLHTILYWHGLFKSAC